jgi:GNAT superfamily N-acetyltransferase
MRRSRRIRPLTARDLERLPGPTAAGDRDAARSNGKRHGWFVDAAWAEQVCRQWGACGVMAINDGQVIGYLIAAPPELLPKNAAFAAGASRDAAVILTGWVVEEHRGHGIGKQLVQAIAALGVRRSYRAIEAFGTSLPGPGGLLPVRWLTSVGFQIDRPHPITPRLRMELKTTVRRRRFELSAVLSRLTGLVARPAPPEPVAYEPAHYERSG